MPHSSGGGSHGGGSHGGHSSGGSSTPHNTVARSSFYGAHRYAYYRRRRVYYCYSDMSPATYRFPLGEILIMAIVALAMIAVCAFGFANARYTPEFVTGATDTRPIIFDEVGLIDNEAQLQDTLQRFANTTGVVPMVFVCYNDTWQYNYGTLEAYSYRLYLDMCDDESHWLLVYSVQRDNPSNWSWEGMQGNDTDRMLHQKMLKSFNNQLHRGFNNNVPVGENFNTTFEDALPNMRKPTWDKDYVILSVVSAFFVVVIGYMCIDKVLMFRSFANADEAPENAEEIVCQYCGGKYLNKKKNCPHCGASNFGTHD